MVKKTVYDKLVEKVNKSNTSGFVLKTKYDADKSEIEKKVLILVNLLKKQITIMKLLKLKIKYLIISGLVANPALTAVEDKIPDISSLVKTTTDNNKKITETENKLTNHDHDKYITTPEFNKVTAENFAARLKQANLVTKAYFDDKLKSINRKISSNKTKHLVVKNKLKKLKRFDFML